MRKKKALRYKIQTGERKQKPKKKWEKAKIKTKEIDTAFVVKRQIKEEEVDS